MDTKIYELLSIFKYPISDNLFKEKIGTGEELEKLLEKEILEKDKFGYYKVNFHSKEIASCNNLSNKKELHQNIIETYYLRNIDKEVNMDYSKFVGNYIDYINLSYHYRELKDFNSAIEKIFYIAKKSIFWGFGHELLIELDNYKDHELNHENFLWKQYYLSFYNFIHPAGEINEKEFFNLIGNIEEQDLNNFYALYLEVKNLEGIYFKQIKNDNKKAVKIFKEEVKKYEKFNKDLCKNIEIAYGRILENLAMGIHKTNMEKSNEYFNKAKDIFKKYDENYELAKLHLFKLTLLGNDNEENIASVIEEHDQLSTILNKYAFPDIERNLFNLRSDELFRKEKDFNGYIEMKIQALIRDTVLYFENFEMDFIDVLQRIEETLKSVDNNIEASIDLLLEFLSDAEFLDELHFVEGIKNYLSDKGTSKNFSKIKNTNLREFAYEYIERLNK